MEAHMPVVMRGVAEIWEVVCQGGDHFPVLLEL